MERGREREYIYSPAYGTVDHVMRVTRSIGKLQGVQCDWTVEGPGEQQPHLLHGTVTVLGEGCYRKT
jgi:hypothetical protein